MEQWTVGVHRVSRVPKVGDTGGWGDLGRSNGRWMTRRDRASHAAERGERRTGRPQACDPYWNRQRGDDGEADERDAPATESGEDAVSPIAVGKGLRRQERGGR
jgi:hypothetical protein